MESEKLVVKNHPIFPFLYRQFLNVGKETDWHDDDSSISKDGTQLAPMLAEVETLYSYICFLNLAHYLMFFTFATER